MQISFSFVIEDIPIFTVTNRKYFIENFFPL